jgi:hypothetical protein
MYWGNFNNVLKIGGYRGLIETISAISSGIIMAGHVD